jgi:integrase
VPRFILLVGLLATTGMRLGEALALTWPNVDLPGRATRLPASAAAVAILEQSSSETAM